MLADATPPSGSQQQNCSRRGGGAAIGIVFALVGIGLISSWIPLMILVGVSLLLYLLKIKKVQIRKRSKLFCKNLIREFKKNRAKEENIKVKLIGTFASTKMLKLIWLSH